jgi:hypothetical protein
VKRDWPLIGLIVCLVLWGLASTALVALGSYSSWACRDAGGVPVNDGRDCIRMEKVKP